jgi:hypothetical protein
MEALSNASKVETMRMLNSVVDISTSPTHNSGTMEALSNASKVETMRMLNSIVDIGTSECGSDPTVYEFNKVLLWIYTCYTKSTGNDRPRAYRKALEALVKVIEKDNTSDQRAAILFVKKILTYLMKENLELLQIIFEENDNNETNESRVIFTIHTLSPLKGYCNLYAKNRGISIKYLRFSYKGKMLFLSDRRGGTPETLGIRVNDVIMVHLLSDSNKENMTDTSNQKHMATTNKKNKMVWKKSSRGKAQIKLEKHTMTVEDYKRQHSMILSKLHEEMQPRLGEIRMKLNTLDIERQPPKSKNKGGRKCTKEEPIDLDAFPISGVGGKAGRHHFIVQVGEVQNLYKTTKSSALASHQSRSSVTTLDLHGCTREEAIASLNESLEEWVDIAMKGYDPFVVTAVIVCGCGTQVLSETVKGWIKSTSQVRNAPKNHFN